MMSQDFELFDNVRLGTDQFAELGVPAGSIEYVIEKYADGAMEIEVSNSLSGETIAEFVAEVGDLERVKPCRLYPG